jgi:hypothetical protein
LADRVPNTGPFFVVELLLVVGSDEAMVSRCARLLSE